MDSKQGMANIKNSYSQHHRLLEQKKDKKIKTMEEIISSWLRYKEKEDTIHIHRMNKCWIRSIVDKKELSSLNSIILNSLRGRITIKVFIQRHMSSISFVMQTRSPLQIQ
jgi:hypothetical protein